MIIFIKIILENILILAILVVLGIFVNLNKLLRGELREDSSYEECKIEWEKLNDKLYFRKGFSFYYKDIKKIRIFYLNHKNVTHKAYEIKLYSEDNQYLTTLKNVNAKLFSRDFDYPNIVYRVGYLEIDYEQTEIKNFKVIVVSLNHATKNMLNIESKNYNENDDSKKYSMCCSKLSHLDRSYVKTFKWWIEIARLNGYEKMMIFNLSLSNDYNDILNINKDFVQVIQYQCIPNFHNNITHKSYFKLDELKQAFNKKSAFYIVNYIELMSSNECYLRNKDKYKYISNIDLDEFVLPRQNIYEHFKKPDEHQCLIAKKDKSVSVLEPYFDDIHMKLNLTKKHTLSFRMSVHLKMKTMKIISIELEKLFKSYSVESNKTEHILKINALESTVFDYNFLKNPKNLIFDITITNKDEYLYAKYLYDSYIKIVDFLDKNQNIIDQIIDESSNRFFFFFFGDYYMPKYYLYKTFHDTWQTVGYDQHNPRNKYSQHAQVPVELGHLSHFRKNYNFEPQPKSIRGIYFDMDYFTCYYLPTIQKLSQNKIKF